MFFSWEFWAFVVIALLLYNITRGRVQNGVLLAVSYLFYTYLDWRFLGLLWLATTVTFTMARRLTQGAPHRQRYFYTALLFNLGVLGFFKYAGFFVSTVTSVLTRSGAPLNPVFLDILLPLGISFYSFRLLAYLIDVYNERLQPSASWLDFALYVAFFPQIAAGPIERATRFLPALRTTRRISQQQIVDGLTLVFVGIFYKVAIADPLVLTTDNAFSGIARLSSADALSAMILFSIRLYADFAGYSAIAIGVSIWFGLPAMENFRQPYFSQSVIEFWTRWHISLSTWFRDYLFYPLSRSLLRRWGSNRTTRVQVIAYVVTMLATGIWHGANWTFIIWGVLHGTYIAVERFLSGRVSDTLLEAGPFQRRFNMLCNILITQFIVAVAWVFFKAVSVSDALLFFQKMLEPISLTDAIWWARILVPIGLLLMIDLFQSQAKDIFAFWRLRLVWRVALWTILLLLMIIFGGSTRAPFVYFQF